MRLPKRLPAAAALAGLALCAASAAEAGLPTVCTTCAGQPEGAPAAKIHKKRHMHLCPDCAAKATPPAMVMAAAPGGCATCGTSGPGLPPGVAIIGDGNPAPVQLTAGGAPGYAVVGGTMAAAEPAPVGVMRTNYNQDPAAPGSLGASLVPQRGGAPGHATVGGGNIPYARPNEVPPSLYAPQSPRRHSILARVIGVPDFGRRRAEAEARARESHAMTAYGPGSAPSELPASMVYSGGSR